MIILILSLIFLFFSLKIRNRKRIINLIKIIFKIVFWPLKLIKNLIKSYFRNRKIQKNIELKEKLKREKIEKKIKLIQDKIKG